jgi:hypothetical protein
MHSLIPIFERRPFSMDLAVKALGFAKINASRVVVELILTEYGSGIALRFPFRKQYHFNPGDGHPMALRQGAADKEACRQ